MSFVDIVGGVLAFVIALLGIAMVFVVPSVILVAVVRAITDSRPTYGGYRPDPRQRGNRHNPWSSGSDWTYNSGYSSGGWSDGGSSGSSGCDSGSSSSSGCGGGSSSSCGGGSGC
ncbi:hypothetical protein [Nocardia caishijiensis]|uniref:Uncharacterized protein n=1 Tax=Nocardia caishijiensis TaxID=184756 RepID=A0ABQ6YUY5_9NOCA|nr:hypothetical protein [Nocardia caishijiensis]KAF0849349.1 hypothetical protein FNL39_101787 [Nocardia caishijiensis]